MKPVIHGAKLIGPDQSVKIYECDMKIDENPQIQLEVSDSEIEEEDEE